MLGDRSPTGPKPETLLARAVSLDKEANLFAVDLIQRSEEPLLLNTHRENPFLCLITHADK